MISNPSKLNIYTTNVVEFNAEDNAYEFNQGFCIMHQSDESKIEFQIVQEVEFEKSQLLSLSFNISDKDLTLIPIQSSPTWGSVHKKGEQAVATMLVPISDVSKHSSPLYSV